MRPAPTARSRRRLSRTFARSRWREYRQFLSAALDRGYQVVSLEDWIDAGCGASHRTLIVRHDVDQHPGSALRMLAVEVELGVRATWYFRWRTAHPSVVGTVLEAGAGVGLHYESLTRLALARPDADIDSLVEPACEQLRGEIAAFARRFGPIRSACPHGDTRVPDVRNAVLLRDRDPSTYGIEFDGNEAMRGRPLGLWLTDRSLAEGGWAGAVSGAEAIRDGISPILCVAHPNNWVSGPNLWKDRLMASTLPRPQRGCAGRPIRTGSDRPPDG
jgi:hypothetical protein